MLILTRRVTERIIMTTPEGTQIKVYVCGIKGNQVRLGVEAPRDVVIDREEIHLRKTEGYNRETIDIRRTT